MLNVHYTWIGPPDLSDKKSDVVGPLALMSAISDRGEPFVIDFWCLKAYREHFKQQFSSRNFTVVNRQKLEVRSIEGYLEERTGVTRHGYHHRSSPLVQVTNWLLYQMKWDLDLVVGNIIAQSSRSGASVREIVNAKNTWSMYIMYRLGGYAMDTGVGPERGRVRLLSYDSFMAPCQYGSVYTYALVPHRYLNKLNAAVTLPVAEYFHVAAGSDAGPRLDVWTMFAPAGNALLLYGLEWYVRFWYFLEELRLKDPTGDTYKKLCRNGIVSAVMTALCYGDGRRMKGSDLIGGENIWNAVLEDDDTGIPSLKLCKVYFSSHH